MLGGGKVKRIFELHGQGRSIRGIARYLEISRNTVRKYLRSPGVPRMKARPRRCSKLDPYKEHIQQRLHSEGARKTLPAVERTGCDGAFRDRPGRAGPGGLRAVQAPCPRRHQPAGVGFCDGAELVACDVPRVCEASGRRDIHPVSPERLRAAWYPPAMSLRQHQGGGAGSGGRRAGVEHQVPGLFTADGV